MEGEMEEGGREGWRERWREGGREGGRDGGMEGGRDGGREGGIEQRKGNRQLVVVKDVSLKKFGILLFLPVLQILEVVDEFSLLEIALLS